MSDDFLTRSYQPGDESAILGLFHRVFHPHRTLEHWRWKYVDCPWGGPKISLTFSAGGELVAHYAGHPVPFREQSAGGARRLTGLQIGDTMTAPGFRHVGRGPSSLLGRTVAHFYEHHCERQVSFNYGFNTANIQKFSLRFVRAERVADVAYWVRTHTRRLGRAWPWSVYRVAPVERVDPTWDELFERLAAASPLWVERSAAYVDWRYLRCPDPGYRVFAASRGGQLVGWLAGRVVDAEWILGDALFDPAHPEAARALLRTAIGEAEREHGPLRMSTWCAPGEAGASTLGARTARWLAEWGFERRPEPNHLALMVVPFLLGPETAARTAAGYWMRGDGDLF
jgi:hypothetical protein